MSTRTTHGPALAPDLARAIFDVLVEHVGVTEGQREDFLFVQSDHFVEQYRFCGSLDYGGKFRRRFERSADGTDVEVWSVDCYPEHLTEQRRRAIAAANESLLALRRQD